jgi:leucyl aminopeptidase (aminopeptidase T)
MSVLKRNRGVSEMEFYHNAITMRKDIETWLLRDFGIRSNTLDRLKSDIRQQAEKAKDSPTKENIEQYTKLVNIYTNKAEEKLTNYQEWMLEQMRGTILDILRNLMRNITKANTLYPVNEHEVEIRRDYQNDAISDCEDLIQEMQHVMTIIPADVNKLLPYVEKIEYEITLLKGWRKANGKILKRIKNQESKK